MKKNKITSLEYSTITFFLVNSFLMNVGFNILTSKSKTDSILDILLGGILILAFSFLVSNFQKKEKEYDIRPHFFSRKVEDEGAYKEW